MPSGFLFVALLVKRSAQILVRFGELRRKAYGFCKFLDRFRESILSSQHSSEPIVCFSEVGLDRNGFTKVGDGFIKTALNDQGRAQVKMDHTLAR
jgi:hypothetical protein